MPRLVAEHRNAVIQRRARMARTAWLIAQWLFYAAAGAIVFALMWNWWETM